MSTRRKDNSGRVLKDGETYRKDGRYEYRFTDLEHKRHSIYASTLKELREKEETIQEQLRNGLNYNGGNMTVGELLDKFMAIHEQTIKAGTVTQYRYKVAIIKGTPLGNTKVKDVTMSMAKEWVLELGKTGRGQGTSLIYVNILRQAFQMAYEDDLIKKNPFDFNATKLLPKKKTKELLITEEEYLEFIDWLMDSEIYSRLYAPIVIAHETGLRVGEICGLTIADIDLKKKTVKVDHQIRSIPGKTFVDTPKSNASFRTIPLSPKAIEVIEEAIDEVNNRKKNPWLDGKVGFLFLTKHNQVCNEKNMNELLKGAIDRYQRTINPDFPKFTFHSLRHLFCSRMVSSGMTVKNVQYLMGHSSAQVTLNVYAHTSFSAAEKEFKELMG